MHGGDGRADGERGQRTRLGMTAGPRLWDLGGGAGDWEERWGDGGREPQEGPFNPRIGVWNILKRKEMLFEDFKQAVT